MLYKKFHRNYVRQFKKGTVFSFETHRDVVNKEPYTLIDWGNHIRITGINYDLVLIYSNGSINIKIEKDAIQEIPQKLCKAV